MTSIPVSLATTGMSTSSSSESVPMTLVNVGSTVLTKGGKSVLLVQKPLATSMGQAKIVGSKVTTVTPILSNKAVTVSEPSTITVPALKTDKGDLKVILPGGTGETISIMPGKSLITPVTTSPIINRLKVVGTQAQFAPGSVSTFTTTSSLQNATLLTAGDQAQAPTILLASPTKTFTVARGNTTQVLRAMPGTPSKQTLVTAGDQTQAPTILLASPTKTFTMARGNTTQVLRAIPGSPGKQGMVLFSPMKNKQLPMTISTAALAAAAAKSPQRIAPAPNVSSASKVTIVTASPSAGTTTTSSGASILARAAGLSGSPQKIIFRPLVPQVKQGVPSNLVTGQTLTTASGQTLKQVVVPVSSVLTSAGGGHPIQVPGNKFNYFRLVSAPQTSSATTTVSGALKPGTLVPVRTITPAGATGVSVSATSSISGNPVRITVPIAPAVSVSQSQMKIGSPLVQTQQRLLIPNLRQDGNSATTLSQFPSNTLISTNTPGGVQSFVMLSAQYLAQMASQAAGSGTPGPTRLVIQSQATNILPAPSMTSQHTSQGFVPIAAAQPRQVDQQQQQNSSSQSSANKQLNGRASVVEPIDSRIRKPCNCTKSQCLKLYCDCFANGEFCHNCNCNNCFNNLDHEEDRQRAIKSCLDRNPHAFHPKIGKGRDGDHERRHTKGCNCKRSGCLKNYCECYEAKILCTNLCKCVGCKNFEDSSERKTLMHLADAAEVRVQQQAAARTKISSQIQDMPTRPPIVSVTGERLPFSFVTQEVMEATCQCLLARAEDGERNGISVSIMERLVLEEFGRCLMQIIDCANRTKASSSGDH